MGSRAEVLQGVRQMRFEGLLERRERGELSQGEAAEMLGVSERTFRRWRDRLRDEGPAGLRDRRIGKPSSRRAAVEEMLRMVGLYEERYAGVHVKHFHEQLQQRHQYTWATRRPGWRCRGRGRCGARRIARSGRGGRCGHDAASGCFAFRLAARR
jgi:transposase